MPCERKHIEAIQNKYNEEIELVGGIGEMVDLISAALAACDESPCVWMYNKEGWSGNCPSAMTWYENPIGQAFTFCPHCGRKIEEAPLPAAPEVGDV